ncbi:hypothetical protein FRC04_009278 [Tulasnella sp. 424]|nr:hypothetical protein FRC04_009278 [Tulasnella sp. 424]KAG8973098.1 hypothetical protein FRC05_009107 [Tulasnella sp. 425]
MDQSTQPAAPPPAKTPSHNQHTPSDPSNSSQTKMSSAAAGGVEYYSSVPTFIPPTSYSDTGVPTFDPNTTPSPIQDLSSPPSSNHAHPSTPSPEPEQAPNPYANDPWSPQLNQSIKVEPSLQPPKSPNLGAQRKMQSSRFAVPAPSAGAAGYRSMSEYSSAVSLATPQRAEQEEFGLSPVQAAPAVAVTPSDKSPSSKGSLSKSLARFSMSFSGRSKSGKKNSSPPVPIDEPAPQPSYAASSPIPRPTQHQRPVSFAGSTAPSSRPRSFVIPQTLEEWEAFNKAMLSPAPPPSQTQRPQQSSSHLRPPSGSSSMLPGPRLAASLAASPGGSPRNSPRGSPRNSPRGSPKNSPRRSVVDLPPLPPPPIVLGEWERKRLAEAQGIPFPQAPPPQERPGSGRRQTTDGTPPSSAPSSRPTSPVGENKRSSMLLFARKSTGAVSPGAVNTTPTPFLLPKTSSPTEQSPSPSRVPSPNPAPLAAAPIIYTPPAEPAPNAAPVVQPAEPEREPEPEARPRTISLPDGPKAPRPSLAPIQTDVSSSSLKWSRPMSWMGGGGGGGGGGSRLRSMSTTDLTTLVAVNRGGDVGDDDPEGEIRPRVISIERYNPNSNGARLRAMRKSSRNSSIDLTTSGSAGADKRSLTSDDKRSFMSEGGRMRNLLRKRRPSSASESGAEGALDNSKLKQKQQQQPPQGAAMALPPGAGKPMLGKNYAVSPGAVSPSPAAEVESKDEAAPAPAATPAGTQRSTKEKRRSRLFSFGSKNTPAPTLSMAAALAAGPGAENDATAPAPAAAAPVVAPAAAAPADSSATPAGTTAEKRRSRRFSFGVKNAATTASPSPANDVEGDGGDKRRSRRFSFGMKNPFNKKESSESASASPAPAVNPHALLPPGAAPPAMLSRAGSQATADTSSSSNVPSTVPSTVTTPPASSTNSAATSIKAPSPPPPSSPLAAPLLVRSANNSSTSLAGKINPFKRKPPPSISDESFVIVPTFNTGKGKLKLEISDAERERLERMSAPPSLPTSRPQTPSDLTVPVRLFGSGKRGSFFEDGDDADKEEKIDEKNNRVSRFLSEYAANNELGLAIPSPSLRGVPLAPSSMSDSTTNNSIAATDSTGHSDATARVKTPERFEY